MSGPEEQDELEIKRKMAREGPKVKKEADRPGKLMVSGIPKTKDFSKEQLEKEFAVFGKVTEVNVIRNKRTGDTRGFAFVTFENPADAENAIKQMEGKDLGGENPVHCEQAVIGLIRQSQIATGLTMSNRGRGGPVMERGRGGPSRMDRGRGFRGMRGVPPPQRGGRGRGSYGGGGEGDGTYYQEDNFYGGGEQYDNSYSGGYPERNGGGGGPRGRGPHPGMMQRGMRGRGAPPGIRGRGAAPHPAGRGRAGGPPDQGRGLRRPLLPHPAQMRGGRGGGRGRGYPPPPQEEYYPEEEAYGAGEEYPGGEEYYEEDPYSSAAGYAEEDQYGYSDEGYFGGPEDHPRPAPRGRGGAPPATASQRGRGVRTRPPSYRGAGAAPARGGLSRGGGAPPARPVKRQPNTDAYGYPEHQVDSGEYVEEYYDQGEMEAYPPAAADPYNRPKPPTGRGQPAGPGRGRPLRQQANHYAEDTYGTYEAENGAQSEMYEGEGYEEPYVGRRGSAAPPQARPQAGGRGRAAESAGYVDISEYVGQGSSGPPVPRSQNATRQYSERETEVRKPVHPPREELYVGHGATEGRDGYASYPPSLYVGREARESLSRKRQLDYVGEGDARPYYDDYRRMEVPNKRERLDRAAYDGYSSRQEGHYRGL